MSEIQKLLTTGCYTAGNGGTATDDGEIIAAWQRIAELLAAGTDGADSDSVLTAING